MIYTYKHIISTTRAETNPQFIRIHSVSQVFEYQESIGIYRESHDHEFLHTLKLITHLKYFSNYVYELHLCISNIRKHFPSKIACSNYSDIQSLYDLKYLKINFISISALLAT